MVIDIANWYEVPSVITLGLWFWIGIGALVTGVHAARTNLSYFTPWGRTLASYLLATTLFIGLFWPILLWMAWKDADIVIDVDLRAKDDGGDR